jgi:hypothetical protein
MATKAESLMKAFWTNDFLELSTFKIEDLDENQSRLAGYQIYFAEHFIFGHELGHVVLNCSDQEKILKGIVAVLHRDGFGQSVDMKTLQEWACEIRADQLGLDLLLSHVEEIGEPKFDKSSPL